jgi:hypothetical protein
MHSHLRLLTFFSAFACLLLSVHSATILRRANSSNESLAPPAPRFVIYDDGFGTESWRDASELAGYNVLNVGFFTSMQEPDDKVSILKGLVFLLSYYSRPHI